MANNTVESAPPRDSVWTKYSPNHEFPVASVVSLTLHGLAVAAILIAGWMLNARWHGTPSAPPKVDVAVFVKDEPGDGNPQPGGSPGSPGARTELVETKTPPNSFDQAFPKTANLELILPPPLSKSLDIPVLPTEAGTINLDAQFKALNLTPLPEPKRIVGPSKGPVGSGGKGTGTGTGDGPGPGPGKAGPGGSPNATETRAEVLAKRWRFNLSGSPQEHMQKLLTSGVRVGFVDARDRFFVITDLKKRPVAFQLESYDKYKDAVQWSNRLPESINGLTFELGLKGPPNHFVLFLPQHREQKFADVELEYTKRKNGDIRRVQETLFDFRIIGGDFEPFILGQVLVDGTRQ